MPRKEKLGTLRGVSQWKKLESAGDIKRLMAWCIHSIRDQSLDPKVAAIMAQIGAFMLKAMEADDFSRDLTEIKRRLDMPDEGRTANGITAH
jgi:hypothetical protein